MLVFLRCVGITNAAVWLGAVVFYTVGVAPSFTASEMSKILPALHREAAVQLILARYFTLHCWCAGIALAHLVMEWMYTGKPLQRWVRNLLIGLLAWGLTGVWWLQPELQRLHLDLYGIRSTTSQRQHAVQPYHIWQGVFRAGNLLANLGVLAYLLRAALPPTTARFANKFRG